MPACFVCQSDVARVVLREDASKWRWVECNQCGIRGPVQSTAEDAWGTWRLLGAEVQARIDYAASQAAKTAPPPESVDVSDLARRVAEIEARLNREDSYRQEQNERGNE